jgi:hypothetical protein
VGLFFESPDLVNLIETALRTPPPPQSSEDATWMATQMATDLLHPLVQTLSEALQSPTPANPHAAAKVMAQGAMDELLAELPLNTRPSFITSRFLIAISIFAVLAGGGVATEAIHLTTAAGTLFGFAGGVFGVVTAFLGSEKGSG